MYSEVDEAGELHSRLDYGGGAAHMRRGCMSMCSVPATEGWRSGADITVLGCSFAVAVRLMVQWGITRPSLLDGAVRDELMLNVLRCQLTY